MLLLTTLLARVGGHSLTTLKVATYLPTFEMDFPLLLKGKICLPLTFLVQLRYFFVPKQACVIKQACALKQEYALKQT